MTIVELHYLGKIGLKVDRLKAEGQIKKSPNGLQSNPLRPSVFSLNTLQKTPFSLKVFSLQSSWLLFCYDVKGFDKFPPDNFTSIGDPQIFPVIPYPNHSCGPY